MSKGLEEVVRERNSGSLVQGMLHSYFDTKTHMWNVKLEWRSVTECGFRMGPDGFPLNIKPQGTRFDPRYRAREARDRVVFVIRNIRTGFLWYSLLYSTP